MNSYDVNRNNSKNPGVQSRQRNFPDNGNKKTVSFAEYLDPNTKTCLISVSDTTGGYGRIETVWYTFDGSVPRPNNGHRMTSRSILKLPAEAVQVARFSNQPGQQGALFILRMDQLS
jgi:hypothetical protein